MIELRGFDVCEIFEWCISRELVCRQKACRTQVFPNQGNRLYRNRLSRQPQSDFHISGLNLRDMLLVSGMVHELSGQAHGLWILSLRVPVDGMQRAAVERDSKEVSCSEACRRVVVIGAASPGFELRWLVAGFW